MQGKKIYFVMIRVIFRVVAVLAVLRIIPVVVKRQHKIQEQVAGGKVEAEGKYSRDYECFLHNGSLHHFKAARQGPVLM
jgi:hypothetical protein